MRTDVKMLLILHDETDMFGELPLYEAIVRRLHQLDISGATVQRGIMGFGSHGKVHRKGLFGISDDRPITICVVDTAEKLEPIVPEIRAMIEEGIVLLVDAQMVV
jgi:PII-like signaling protein